MSSTYGKEHYQKHKQYYKDKAKTSKQAQRNALRKIIRESKNVPCKDCGVAYPYYVMQFDHVGDDKKLNIADGVGQGIAVSKLVKEISKCDVVCSNCHAIRTHERTITAVKKDRKPCKQIEMVLFPA